MLQPVPLTAATLGDLALAVEASVFDMLRAATRALGGDLVEAMTGRRISRYLWRDGA
jgi:hypothetical protein